MSKSRRDTLPSAQPASNWDAIEELIGCIQDGPEEAIGANHDQVLTPEMELRMLVEEFALRTARFDAEEVAAEIDRAVREVCRQRMESRESLSNPERRG